jgi:hypothetical protein
MMQVTAQGMEQAMGLVMGLVMARTMARARGEWKVRGKANSCHSLPSQSGSNSLHLLGELDVSCHSRSGKILLHQHL